MSDVQTGARVRVREGVAAPDLPEFSIGGWSGVVVKVSGSNSKRRCFIEWDAETLARMPVEYAQACEERQLYRLMTCLPPDDVDPV